MREMKRSHGDLLVLGLFLFSLLTSGWIAFSPVDYNMGVNFFHDFLFRLIICLVITIVLWGILLFVFRAIFRYFNIKFQSH